MNLNRETIQKYNRGELVSAHEFNSGSLDFFADVVWPMALHEQATRQLGFDGDIYYKRVHPLEFETPEKERLARPVVLKNGISQTIVSRFDDDLEKQRITEIRKELSSFSPTIPTRRDILDTKEHLKNYGK